MNIIQKHRQIVQQLNSRIAAHTRRLGKIPVPVPAPDPADAPADAAPAVPNKPEKKKWSLRKKFFTGIAVLFIIALLFFIFSNLLIIMQRSRIHTSVENLPECHTALVLGCSPTIGDRDNLFFRARMEAAAELYHSGKVKTLLLSGDNGRKGYNEPEAMRQALIKKGVPDEKIYCDYAGFSTLDSIIRANTVFGQKKFIIVSQGFHCERAIFLSRAKGLDTFGFAAKDIDLPNWKIKNHARESLARPAAILDLCTFRSAKFGGEKVDMTVPQIKAD